nr:hypothetical protein Iba_chr02aCG18870 [Ipomoea batatas]
MKGGEQTRRRTTAWSHGLSTPAETATDEESSRSLPTGVPNNKPPSPISHLPLLSSPQTQFQLFFAQDKRIEIAKGSSRVPLLYLPKAFKAPLGRFQKPAFRSNNRATVCLYCISVCEQSCLKDALACRADMHQYQKLSAWLRKNASSLSTPPEWNLLFEPFLPVQLLEKKQSFKSREMYCIKPFSMKFRSIKRPIITNGGTIINLSSKSETSLRGIGSWTTEEVSLPLISPSITRDSANPEPLSASPLLILFRTASQILGSGGGKEDAWKNLAEDGDALPTSQRRMAETKLVGIAFSGRESIDTLKKAQCQCGSGLSIQLSIMNSSKKDLELAVSLDNAGF